MLWAQIIGTGTSTWWYHGYRGLSRGKGSDFVWTEICRSRGEPRKLCLCLGVNRFWQKRVPMSRDFCRNIRPFFKIFGNFWKTDPCLGLFQWKAVPMSPPMSGDFLQNRPIFTEHPHYVLICEGVVFNIYPCLRRWNTDLRRKLWAQNLKKFCFPERPPPPKKKKAHFRRMWIHLHFWYKIWQFWFQYIFRGKCVFFYHSPHPQNINSC